MEYTAIEISEPDEINNNPCASQNRNWLLYALFIMITFGFALWGFFWLITR